MGQPAEHVPVLAREISDALAAALPPADAADGRGVFVDATCGLGGHSNIVLARYRPALAVLFDRDAQALAIARERLGGATCPIHFVHAPFATLAGALAELGVARVDAIIADLGVSSLQLDTPERGFSLRADAPLDMRMDPTRGEPVAALLARIEVPELARILREYGEEPDALRIARRIVDARPTTTGALARIVADAMSARQRRKLGVRIHPATRTFQALRIHINGELDQLDALLADAPGLLVVGGRLAIITFHSLEDRRVKHRFRALTSLGQPPSSLPVRADELPRAPFVLPPGHRRAVEPSADEIAVNPRARSARLRVVERVAN